MKHLLVFLMVVCVAYGAWQSGLRAKFAVGARPGIDFFFPIPRTVLESVSDGWTLAERPTDYLPSLVMYCSGDRVMCALYDQDGNVSGLQISVAKDEISGSELDWVAQGFISWNATTAAGVTKEFWSIYQYFITEATFKLSKEERIRAFDRNGMLREGAVFVSGFNGELMKISSNGTDIVNSDDFTHQSCVPWMGHHYYYKLTSEATCLSDTLFPWFTLVDSGELIGTGLSFYGQSPVIDGERDWYERSTRSDVEANVPNAPECVYNLADSPGIITMHIYYVEKPWTIEC